MTREAAEATAFAAVFARRAKRRFAASQKGASLRRGLKGKPLPNSRRRERGWR